VQAGARIAAALGLPLTLLGVSSGASDDPSIDEALRAGSARARESVASVEIVRATGRLLDVASNRVEETPTALVVLGANPRAGRSDGQIAPGVWQLIKSLSPPALVTPPGDFEPRTGLFCTGGERFIEEGARFAARIAGALKMSMTVFHVAPSVPAIYGDELRDREVSVSEFLDSNSRLARSVRRQIEIFRSAGVETTLRLASGDVIPAVMREVRRQRPDLVIVGSAPQRGAFQAYMLGDRTREIVERAGRPFLVVRSRRPGLLSELWRSLKDGAAAETEPAKSS
jgi:nucleotide-binding universal stress UspA family protein